MAKVIFIGSVNSDKKVVVLHDSFKDKEGKVIEYDKPYLFKDVDCKVGDDVEILYNSYKKPVALLTR